MATKKPARLKKGSKAAKEHMAAVRAGKKMSKAAPKKRKANPTAKNGSKFQVRVIMLSGKKFTRTVTATSKQAARKKAMDLFKKNHPSAQWQTVTISAPGKKLPTTTEHEKRSRKITAQQNRTYASARTANARRNKANPHSPKRRYEITVKTSSGTSHTLYHFGTTNKDAKDKARAKFEKAHPRTKIKSVTAKAATAKRKSNPKKRTPGRPRQSNRQKMDQASSPMYTTKPSQATGRAPSKRLQRRRSRNVKTGTFPNPTGHLVVAIQDNGKVGYYDGFSGFDTSKGNAVIYPSFQKATKAAKELAPKIGNRAQIAAVSRNTKVAEIRQKAGV